jgi:AraC-like DNA-binding protein
VGTLIETTNAAAAYDTLSSLYGVRRFTAPGKRPLLRVTQDQIGPASLDRLTFGMDCDLDGGPRDALFLGYLGAGHIAYLRRTRLEHAHHQLTEADPGHETVTAVAYQWGFSSSSRFAARYRQAYGVTPSETLRDWGDAGAVTGSADDDSQDAA